MIQHSEELCFLFFLLILTAIFVRLCTFQPILFISFLWKWFLVCYTSLKAISNQASLNYTTMYFVFIWISQMLSKGFALFFLSLNEVTLKKNCLSDINSCLGYRLVGLLITFLDSWHFLTLMWTLYLEKLVSCHAWMNCLVSVQN